MTSRTTRRPVRFAVIGTNWITGSLIDAGRTVPGFEVVAVGSRSVDTGRAFADRYGIATVHGSVEAVGADPDVDAVYVASPNSLHATQACAMLAAGKHVLVEKPFGANSEEATATIAAGRAAGRLVMEAYTASTEPNFAAIREAIPRVGRVRRVVLTKDQYSSRYDAVRAGGTPNAFNPAFAGGSLMDLGVYCVSAAIHLFGTPRTVTATGILLPTGVDGQGTLVLGYDGFEVIGLHSKIAPAGIGSQVAGEDGVLTFDDCSVPTRVELSPRGAATEDLTREQSVLHMRYEVAEFVGLVQSGATESSINSPARSLAVMNVLDEARRQVGVRFPGDG